MDVNLRWDVMVECLGGSGCRDLLVQRQQVKRAVIQEYNRISLAKKDKKEGYSKSKCGRLTKMADEALAQIESSLELHEYGISFLGQYCAVVERSLTRKKAGRNWKITMTYGSEEDEERRTRVYAPAS
jgi:hypothetical protein